MAKIFITGSSDGLGLLAGRSLTEQGHTVVLHARSRARAQDAQSALPQANAVLIGDVSTLAGMRDVADQANALGNFDAVIHNVGLGHRDPPHRVETADGLSRLWAVNVLAPYVLTGLMHRPKRMVYLSSALHLRANPDLNDLQWTQRAWDSGQAYADTKLQDLLLAFGVARRWPEVWVNAVTPGWVATRMGGPEANDDLEQGYRTQTWLAVSDDQDARVTGEYLYHQQPERVHSVARDTKLQNRLFAVCHEVSGVDIPFLG